MIELIAFDADDTLWHTEHLYQMARQQFRDLMAPHAALDSLDDLVHETEMRNLPLYGFGITSFILSLIEAAVEITGGAITGAEIGRLLALSRQMVSADVELIDEVEETLAALAADYPLLLITKGDLLHQQDKVARSGLGRYFTGVEVVADKTAETYREILIRRAVAPERFVMVGNSPRSTFCPWRRWAAARYTCPTTTRGSMIWWTCPTTCRGQSTAWGAWARWSALSADGDSSFLPTLSFWSPGSRRGRGPW